MEQIASDSIMLHVRTVYTYTNKISPTISYYKKHYFKELPR